MRFLVAPNLMHHLLLMDWARALPEARVLAWDCERVVVSHGEVLEHGGRQALREAFAWLR